jgi:hypothetical protein
MKINFFYIFFVLLFVRCSLEEKTSIQYDSSKYTYHFDTIYKRYNVDFTQNYTGGIDLHFLDSGTFIVYNFCGSNQLKVLRHESDSVMELSYFNPNCKKLFTSIKKDGVYVISEKGELWQYCKNNYKQELLANLMEDTVLKNSGLIIEEFKPGGDQYVRVPENILYFRLKQNYKINDGKYSNKDSCFPIFAKYNLDNKKIELFGKQPFFVTYNEYGFLSVKYDLYIGDSIITSEGCSGLIEVIDTKTHTEQIINCKSRYDIDPIKKWIFVPDMKDAKNKKMEHYLLSGSYESLFYNPFNERYYRIFHPKMDKLDKDGLYNTDSDKECVLMIFDKSLKLIDEVLLPIKTIQVLKLIPSKNGVDIYLPELFKTENNQKIFSFLHIT